MYQNPHYHHDEKTGLITFNREHSYYHLERTVFTSKGVDINRIKTFEQYYDFKIAFRYEIRVAFHKYIQNKNPKTLESKLTQSLILGNDNDFKRLETLLHRMKKSNLEIIK